MSSNEYEEYVEKKTPDYVYVKSGYMRIYEENGWRWAKNVQDYPTRKDGTLYWLMVNDGNSENSG